MNLTISRTWPDDPNSTEDFLIKNDGKAIARILRDRSHYEERWLWSVYGFNIGQTEDMRGMVHTLEEAKAATRPVIERLIAAGAPLLPEPNEWKPGSAFAGGPVIERKR